MTRVLVVGGGVAGLLTVQALLDRARALAPGAGRAPLEVTLLAHRHGWATASRSGGLSLPYASTDERVARWTARSTEIVLAGGPGAAAPFTRMARALLVSRRGPVSGPPGETVDPATLGLPRHTHGLRAAPSPQWDTCRLLQAWPGRLGREPGVRLLDLPERLPSTAGLTALHDAHGADTTVACLGLGAHVLGDSRLRGRLGVLVRGPLPEGTVHADSAVVDDDDALRPRYTVPHRSAQEPGGRSSGPTDGHLHVGGTYLPVDDPADWDDPTRLADRALAEVPLMLADVADRFPAMAGWQPGEDPWWGIRPVRDVVALGRVDPGLVGGRDVVVSHGWGGSGWTIGPAIAEEIARSVLPGTVLPGMVLPGTVLPGTVPPDHDGSHDEPDPLARYGWWRP